MHDNKSESITLIDRLEENAETQPDKASYVFLRDNAADQVVSFRDLKKRVDVVAASLSDRFSPGDRVLILLPTGVDYVVAFLASLAAGLIAVPGYPPRRRRPDERVGGIFSNAEPKVIVGDKENSAICDIGGRVTPRIPVLSVQDLEADGATISQARRPDRNRVAFLQYTSGSTGQPRGVVVTHANLIFNAQRMQKSFGHTTGSLVVSWLPLFHDMGLVGCVLQSLYVGFTSVLFSPASFILAPARWLQAASDFRATTIGGPNFAYDLCVKCISPEQKHSLDLASLRVAFNGSEPVRPQTVERFTAAFSSCGFDRQAFFPCYGLAESTLFVSGGPVRSGPRTIWACESTLERHRICRRPPLSQGGRCLISSGQVADETEVAIVNPQTRSICPPDTVGEIWTASESVADGYWNNASDTEESFGGVLAGDPEGRRYLRTGDTGFVDNGELFVVGRIKDVIIVRGRKIYPQDVEALVEGILGRVHANYVAAFGVEVEAGEALVVVIEADRALSRMLLMDRFKDSAVESVQSPSSNEVARLIAIIREAVAEAFDVALWSLYFMKLGTFPRTSSGKVQRSVCRAAVASTSDIIYEWHSDTSARPQITSSTCQSRLEL